MSNTIIKRGKATRGPVIRQWFVRWWTVCALSAIAVLTGVFAWALYPFQPTTPIGEPSSIDVYFTSDVGYMEGAKGNITPKGNGEELSVSFDIEKPSNTRDNTSEVIELPTGDKITSAKGPGMKIGKAKGSRVLSRAEFSQTVGLTTKPVKVDFTGPLAYIRRDSAVTFVVPTVLDYSPYFTKKTTFPSYLFYFNEVPDAASIDWKASAPSPGRSPGSLAFGGAYVESTALRDTAEYAGTDLVTVRSDQGKVFISGALAAISGGALVTLFPEIRSLRGDRRKRSRLVKRYLILRR